MQSWCWPSYPPNITDQRPDDVTLWRLSARWLTLLVLRRDGPQGYLPSRRCLRDRRTRRSDPVLGLVPLGGQGALSVGEHLVSNLRRLAAGISAVIFVGLTAPAGVGVLIAAGEQGADLRGFGSRTVTYVGVVVRDVDSAAAAWADVLGVEVSSVTAGQGHAFVDLTPELGLTIEMTETQIPTPLGTPGPPATRGMKDPARIGLMLGDADAFRNRHVDLFRVPVEPPRESAGRRLPGLEPRLPVAPHSHDDTGHVERPT